MTLNLSKGQTTALILSALINFLPLSAKAQETSKTDKVEVRGQAIFQYITEEDRDLGSSGSGTNDSFSEQLQVSVKATPLENTTLFFQGRALNIDGEAGFDDDTGETESLEQSFLELRELWVRWDQLGGMVPLGLQVGRQRLREPRSLWWNSDFDMVRLNYNTTLLNGFIGAGEELSSYRTENNNDFENDDEDRFRTLGELSWQYKLNHFIEGRFLYEHDHSGTHDIGDVIDDDGQDIEDLDVVWAGIRATGSFQEPHASISSFKYRADLIGLAGESENTAYSDTGVVTGTDDRDVRAWAFDGGVTVAPKVTGGVVFAAGYAYGSGDDGSGTDNQFRQTDLQGSSSRIGLERQQQKNYGEVLRPELSNLHILSASVGIPVTEGTDVNLSYFNYHLAEEDGDLLRSGVSAALNGTDKDVGQAADFIINVDVDKELDLKSAYIDGINFRVIAGSFFPGDAYSPNDDEEAYRLFTELKFSF